MKNSTIESIRSIFIETITQKKVMEVDLNFFEAGGNSLLAILLLIKIEQAFGIKIPNAVFNQNPTIMGVTEFVNSHHT